MQPTMKPKKSVNAQTQIICDKKRHFKNQNLHNNFFFSHNYNIINSMNNLHSCFVFKPHIIESLKILYCAFTFAPSCLLCI